MKNLRSIISVCLVVTAIGFTNVYAQAPAAKAPDKKALKKELKVYKKMKPIQIRKMKLDYEARITELEAKVGEMKKLQSSKDSVQRLLNEANTKSQRLELELASAKNETSNATKGVVKGYSFRVQLGAFENFNIKKKISNDEAMQSETADGMDKYTVGLFFKFEDADAFKQDIRKMGIKDAFIVAYKDGVRTSVREAINATK